MFKTGPQVFKNSKNPNFEKLEKIKFRKFFRKIFNSKCWNSHYRKGIEPFKSQVKNPMIAKLFPHLAALRWIETAPAPGHSFRTHWESKPCQTALPYSLGIEAVPNCASVLIGNRNRPKLRFRLIGNRNRPTSETQFQTALPYLWYPTVLSRRFLFPTDPTRIVFVFSVHSQF